MKIRTRRTLTACFTLLSLSLTAAAQQTPYNSRVEEIEAARKRKAENLKPEEVSGTERFLVEFKERRILEKITFGIGGLRPRIGALVTGSGFAAGPEYFRDDLKDGAVLFRATTQFSTNLYQLYDVELAFPRLAGNNAFLSLEASYRNFPQMQYYGPGPDSKKTGLSNYRLEYARFDVTGGVRPFRHVRIGGTVGLLLPNVGPGTNDRYISTELQYSPAMTPGINQQSDFLQTGVFAHYDYRDNTAGPRSGGFYSATMNYNRDIDLKRHTHPRLDLEAQQYIPFFNARRVIALRARSELTWKSGRNVLPFYLQPTLGGSNDLRGFRPFRFSDDNMMVMNAEYRYEVFAGLDMAVFADAGKVFHSKRDWNFHDLEASYGVGMRFNARNAVFMRIDAGFSHEGFQVWVKFNNVF
jgi:outer membrane protein assembly factor BamA